MHSDYGLVGSALSHSYSKLIHESFGEYCYDLIELSYDELKEFISGRKFKGLNVTIPYKEKVIPFCDNLSDYARDTGTVNTLYIDKDNKLWGYNTDISGFEYMILKSGVRLQGAKVLILGSGGTSHTANYVISRYGGIPLTVSRRGPLSYSNLSCHYDSDYIVNTTPVGMYPNIYEKPLSLKPFTNLKAVFDVIYNPIRTALMTEAESLGIPAYSGLNMLVYQAAKSYEIFTGKTLSDETIDSVISDIKFKKVNIVLTGMPGVGKTTVGKKLAKVLGRDFVDTDALIIQKTGMGIPEFFSKYGEERFREIESGIVKDTAAKSALVISLGGGSVLRSENSRAIRQNSIVIHLTRDIASLSFDGRPLSKDYESVKAMAHVRMPIYAGVSDFQTENSGTTDDTVNTILEGLKCAF